MEDLRGRLVVLDFWTSCCINCMHILPKLKVLEQQFGSKLIVIGIHSPKFQREQSAESIREAVQRYRILHPVVNDPQMQMWDEYSVRAWPSLMFVDPTGKVVFKHEGEFELAKLQTAIGMMLDEYTQAGLISDTPLSINAEIKSAADGPLFFPGKVDRADGLLFIADSGHSRIIITEPDGKVLEVVGSGLQGCQDGSFTSAEFDNPQGMVMHEGALFVADTGSHTIRRLDLQAKTVTTVAGTGEQSLYPHRGGNARANPLSSPYDLTVSREGMYVAMAGRHQIWRFDPSAGIIEQWAGSGHEGIRDDLRHKAHLAQPTSVSSARRDIFFTDSETSSVRVAREGEGGRVVTLVGSGLFDYGDSDGIGKNARLQHPQGIVAVKDHLYVADTYNNRVKCVSLASLRVTTLELNPKTGTPQQEAAMAFNEPAGICDGGGDLLYVADTNHHQIRIVNRGLGTAETLSLQGL